MPLQGQNHVWFLPKKISSADVFCMAVDVQKGSAEPGWICKLLRSISEVWVLKSLGLWSHKTVYLQVRRSLALCGQSTTNQAAPRERSSLFPSTTQATSVEDFNKTLCLWSLGIRSKCISNIGMGMPGCIAGYNPLWPGLEQKCVLIAPGAEAVGSEVLEGLHSSAPKDH